MAEISTAPGCAGLFSEYQSAGNTARGHPGGRKDSMERVCHYPDACQEKLKQALAEYEQVPVEWLICGNGAAELIFALVQAVKPKRALVLAPTFAEYARRWKLWDVR